MRSSIKCILATAMGFGVVSCPASQAQVGSVSRDSNSRMLEPGSAKFLSVADADIKAEINPAVYPYVLKVEPVSLAGEPYRVPLSENLGQVDELDIWKDKIVVRGMLNNALADIIVLDKKTGSQQDEFWAYWPSVSIKSGLIIFTKEYPIHFADGTEDHYMLYRLDKPIESNHAPGSAPLKALPAGIPIYPVGTGNVNFDNIALRGPLHEQSAAGFFWNDSGTQAVTLDSFNGRQLLVLMQFQGDGAKVSTYDVNAQSICSEMSIQPCPTSLYLHSASFVTGVDGITSIVATFGRPQDQRVLSKRVSIESFTLQAIRDLAHPAWSGTPK